jgi:hypothetical protein
MRCTPSVLAALIAFRGLSAAQVPSGSMDPAIQKIIESISEDRMAAHMRKLESFGTRNTLSTPSEPGHGIQAARQWLAGEFKSYSPRLQVRMDTYHVKKQGSRFFRDADVVNIVAVLPGTREPERQVVVSAHYDSIHVIRDAAPPGGLDLGEVNGEKSAAEPLAPGVSDDASGVAAVLELARVMSQHEFATTVVFVAFDAEEDGLFGANLYAAQARGANQRIEAVLNNDIIGSEATGDGRAESRRVLVFSPDPADSPARGLARFVKEIGERYVPSMKVDTVFREDRFARGGDHTAFNTRGFAAVRFTSAAERLEYEHTANDTFANASVPYATRVARINAAALASLALAPPAPEVTHIAKTGLNAGKAITNLDRGKSGYAALLRWSDASPAVAGYEILIRNTTSPGWQERITVGNVHEYLIESFNIDDAVIGVRAVDAQGHASLTAAFATTPVPAVDVKTAP